MITKDEFDLVRRKAATLKALVIGDAMLDKYIHGKVDRISPEAPVPIVKLDSTETKAGGAANVALNLAAWGCETILVGIIGDDLAGEELKSILQHQHIQHHFYVLPGRPTTVKTRVVAASHHLLRIDDEVADYLDTATETGVMEFISKVLSQHSPDLIILEDYNKGLLTEKIIDYIINYAHAHDIYIAIDPKEVNFMHYKGADLFKPNLREAVNAAHRHLEIADLEELARQWRKELNVKLIAITLGADGVFLQDNEKSEIIRPDRAIDVLDVCGAGDAVICALALGRLSGLDLKKSGALVNLTGAYVCSHSGVVSIDPVELESWV